MIKFEEQPSELQDQVNSYLRTYTKLVDLMKLNADEVDGWMRLRASGSGKIPLQDESWVRSFATEFRKLVSRGNEPLIYRKMVQVFYNLCSNATPEEKNKQQALQNILSTYKNNYWDVVEGIPTKYKGKYLTAEDIIDITHNGYIFHTGQTNPNKVSHEMVRSFITKYPDDNPLIGEYFNIVAHRLFVLGVLAVCLEMVRDDTLLKYDLVEDLKPKTYAAYKMLFLDTLTGQIIVPDEGSLLQLERYL